MSDETPQKFWSIEEVRTTTGLSVTFIYAAMNARELKSLKVGRRRLIRDADLNAWINLLAEAGAR